MTYGMSLNRVAVASGYTTGTDGGAFLKLCDLVVVPAHIVVNCPCEIVSDNGTSLNVELDTIVDERTDVAVEHIGCG